METKKVFKPSKYQQGIYDFITNGTGNAVVSAVAGSGKTTTLLNAISLIPSDKKIIFLAFNTTIKDEIAEKVEDISNVMVKTIHSYGISALRKEFDGLEVFRSKYKVLLKDIFEYHRVDRISILKQYDFTPVQMRLIDNMRLSEEEDKAIENKTGYFNRIVNLCDLGRINLIDMVDVNNGVDSLNHLAIKHNVEIVNGECYRAWHLIKLGVYFIGKIDYTDMVYMPIHYKLQPFTFDFVFVDECQDLSTMQRVLMQKAIKKDTGRMIAVGDEQQAIYGFAGADASSFHKLINQPNTITLPLSVSYRCGKEIIALAKTIVPQIEHCDTAKDGFIDRDVSYKSIKSGDMVLCRQTFPLVSLCLKYLADGIKAFVMGSEISDSLAKMISDTQRKTEKWTMENVFSRLYKENKKLVKSVMEKEKLSQSDAEQSSVVSLHLEKIQVIELLSKGLTHPNEVVAKILDIFSSDEKNEGICLSTIHKSKGLESDRVFIIHQELMPSKYARKDWEVQQEQNLIYVAYTRAKSVLGFVTDFNAWKDHESQESNAKDVKESVYVGEVGGKVPLELEVVLVKEVLNTAWGDATLYEMVDGDGNLFTKFGVIADRFIVSNHSEVKEGTRLKFNATIKSHKEFKGVKTTTISTIAKYEVKKTKGSKSDNVANA